MSIEADADATARAMWRAVLEERRACAAAADAAARDCAFLSNPPEQKLAMRRGAEMAAAKIRARGDV